MSEVQSAASFLSCGSSTKAFGWRLERVDQKLLHTVSENREAADKRWQ